MSRRRRTPVKLFDTHSEYIDPQGCGSTIGYKIVRTASGYMDAAMNLSDCNRLIQWEFGYRPGRLALKESGQLPEAK